MNNDLSLISILTLFTLLPFIIACGTCFLKFSIVFIMVRNALGLQQVPSNMVLNGIALMLSMYVMLPIINSSYEYFIENNSDYNDLNALIDFINNGLRDYKEYLIKYSDIELVNFFESLIYKDVNYEMNGDENSLFNKDKSILSLLPAYALSEIKSAFKIGFYLYLPFVVIDLVISAVLLSLGMMMMSPITISTPIKILLFLSFDGWSLLSQGLVMQYFKIQ